MHNPALDKKAAELRSTGMSQQKIADALNVNQSTIHRALQKSEIKALVESEHKKFLQSLPNARQNIQGLIDNYANISDNKERERAWRSSMEMLRSAGLLPSGAPSILLQQITMTQNVSLNPQIISMLSPHSSSTTNIDYDNIIDVNTLTS